MPPHDAHATDTPRSADQRGPGQRDPGKRDPGQHDPGQRDSATGDTVEQRLHAVEAELDALRRERQSLAFGLAHDLHAPLRTIDSFAWLLEQRAAQLDDTGRDHLRRVREAAARMARLVQRLQLFSHAGTEPLQPGHVDLSMLADWIGADLQEAHAERTLELHVQPGLSARGDERLLRTLLLELIDNAWRFTHDPHRVRIEVEGEMADEGLRLRVRDHGIGFDMAGDTRLGEPFRRLHGEEQGAGCGLGLAIARRIAERHGGTLRLESALGVGTVAHLFLPPEAP